MTTEDGAAELFCGQGRKMYKTMLEKMRKKEHGNAKNTDHAGRKKESLRLIAAVALCRLTRQALRRMHSGGTALPGVLAMKLQGDLLKEVSRGMETFIVTGTNGKTTTARMLEHALEASGREVVANRSGANLLSGVTAEFASAADWRGRPTKRYAVIECDEGALHLVTPLVRPKMILVTNLFRDQLDRYGEVMHTLEAVRSGIREAPDAVLCLNADDSLTASLAQNVPNPVAWFGLEEGCAEKGIGKGKSDVGNDGEAADENGDPGDARYCIRCGTKYRYHYHTFAHLGGFYCPCCGYSRPEPDVAVTSIDCISAEGTDVHVAVRESGLVRVTDAEYGPGTLQGSDAEPVRMRIGTPALYNVYNAAAALCACAAAGYPISETIASLGEAAGTFGRMETFDLDGVRVQMILVKNPAGCNQAIDYLCSLSKPFNAVLCLNDLDADGHDVSWIWDAHYEKLCSESLVRSMCVWGRRAGDMQLRLKYAGAEEDRIRCAKDLRRLLWWIRKSGVPVFILPNYTTMLPLRDALRKASGREEFWKG